MPPAEGLPTHEYYLFILPRLPVGVFVSLSN